MQKTKVRTAFDEPEKVECSRCRKKLHALEGFTKRSDGKIVCDGCYWQSNGSQRGSHRPRR